MFAYEAPLRALQAMSAVPLCLAQTKPTPDADHHYFGQFDSLRDALAQSTDRTDVAHLFGAAKRLKLDNSQRDAVLQALSRPLGLVQGPPGTGKSFCGALLAKAIVDRSDEIILCVCVTNHALDQFLCDLLDFGVDSSQIVRLGRSPKMAERIKALQLERKPCKESRQMRAELNKKLVVVNNRLKDQATIAATMGGKNMTWPQVNRWLQREDRDALTAFIHNRKDGFVTAGLSPVDVYKSWIGGKSKPAGSFGCRKHE